MGYPAMRIAEDLSLARWINATLGVVGITTAGSGRWLAEYFDGTPFVYWALGGATFLTALLFQGFLYRPLPSVTSPDEIADSRHRSLFHVTIATVGTWLYVLGGAMVWAQHVGAMMVIGGGLMLLGVFTGLRGGLPLLRLARFARTDPTLTSDYAKTSQQLSCRNAYLVGLQFALVLALLASRNIVELHASTAAFAITATMVLTQVTTLAWREWTRDA